MSNARTIRFAGWDDEAGKPSIAEIGDLEAIAATIEKQTIPKKERYRDAPPRLDRSNPSVGKWAVVVVESDLGAAKEALAPLIEHRKSIAARWPASLKKPPGILAVKPPPANAEPENWIERIKEAALGPAPHYLLLVGSPDKIPFEAQEKLEQHFWTGRLDVGDALAGTFSWEACHEYAKKVVRYEKGELPVEKQALLYSFAVEAATQAAHEAISLPLQKHLVETLGIDNPTTLFNADAVTQNLITRLQSKTSGTPAIVMTVSHGLERTRDPFQWGALTDSTFVDGERGTPFSAHLVPKDAFAPGAVIFSFACFSAGIPQRSAHRLLMEEGDRDLIKASRTAALPRALLAHPEGPIAFVGHVDRATSESFRELGPSEGSHAFLDFASWTLGDQSELGTLGRAMSTFRERAGKMARELADLTSPAARKARAPSALVNTWIGYHDAAGYMLLGDPAICVGKAIAKAQD